jgi:glycosyltransferase involved in cell wall biosynthesis
MKIVYLSDTHIPSRATNGIQTMRMCGAFAAHGTDVTLVHPQRFGNRPEGYSGDVWAFYGVPQSFRIITLPTPLTLKLSSFTRFARTARVIPLSAWILGRSRPGAEPFIAYSRSMLGAWLALGARRVWGFRSACRGVYVEVHDAPTDAALSTLARADGVVAISSALRDHLVTRCPSLAGRTVVEHDGVDEMILHREPFEIGGARDRLGIETDSFVVGYSGRINRGKGLDTVIRAAELMQSSPAVFVLVGKVYEDDVNIDAARQPPNVRLTGFVPPADVPSYLAAADVLVMPTSANLSYSQFTSPLKLFEYMASGKAVVCSDLPVLREVVEDERNALLFEADDPESLARALRRLQGDHRMRSTLADRARLDVEPFTWERRAARILVFIRERLTAS